MIARTVIFLLFITFTFTVEGQTKKRKLKNIVGKELEKYKKKKKAKMKKKKQAYTLEKFETASFTKEVEMIQKQKSKVRRETIKKLEDLIRKHPYYENRADVYFRLAEIYWEEEKYQHLQKMKEFFKKWDQYEAGILKKKPVEPKEDHSKSLEYYRKILREFPNYSRIDEVLYYLGKGALAQGKETKNRALMKEGEKTLKRLIQNYPNSPLIPRAHLALAEYYFENNSLYFAKMNYEKIVNNYKSSPMYNYALYKLGWVHYNLRNLRKAIEIFKKVISVVGNEKIQFRNQALNDIVQVYSELEDPDAWKEAKEYFLSVLPKKEAYKKLYKLADLYQGNDMHEIAIEMYRSFINEDKTSKLNSQFYARIFDSLKAMVDMKKIEEFVNEIYDFFNPEGTWMTVNKNNVDAVEEAQNLVENGLLFISNYYHRKAEKEHSLAYYKKAAHYYEMYLKRFPNSKKSYFVNFYYAEILYHELHDYKNAAIQYQKVIEKDKKGEYVEDAALGVIYCYEELMIQAGLQKRVSSKGGIKVVKIKKKKQDVTKLKEIKVTKLHPLEKKYVDAADQYVKIMTDFINDPELRKKYPHKGEKIPEIMFIAANVFYKHGMFKEAVKRLQTIFKYNPKHKYASYAVFTLLDCYIRLNRWEKVEEWARKLIKARNFTVKSKAELEKIVAQAMTEQARQLVLQRKYPEAEKIMKKILREFGRKDKKIAATTTFNLGAVYDRWHRLKDAVRTYQKVIRKYPNSEMAPKALFVIGEIYENQTMFEKAAKTFEKMEKFKNDEDAPDALKNAGLIWEALKKYDKAIKIYFKYIKLFKNNPKVKDIPTIYFHIGEVYEAMGDEPYKKAEKIRKEEKDRKKVKRLIRKYVKKYRRAYSKAIKHYFSYIRKYKTHKAKVVEAYSRIGVLYKKIDKEKNRRKAIDAFNKAIKVFSTLTPKEITPASKYFAAQAAFEKTEYLYDDFLAMKITATRAWKLKKELKAKAEMHQKLEKAYYEILNFKSGYWTAAALFRIGYLYYDFAKTLLDAPIPPGLTPDQEDEYRIVLEDFAMPIQEKALTAFTNALKLALKKKVYNKWSKLSSIYAAKVNPDLYPLAKEEFVKVDKVKDTLMSTNFIRTLRRGAISVDILKFRDEIKKNGNNKEGKKNENVK